MWGANPIYKNDPLLKTPTLTKLERRKTLALGPRQSQILFKRQPSTKIEMQKKSYQQCSVMNLRYWNALLLWINIHLERWTLALSAAPPPVLRDKTPNPQPHDSFEIPSTAHQCASGWIMVLCRTSSKVIRLCWVSQSIKAGRNGNGVKHFFKERWKI